MTQRKTIYFVTGTDTGVGKTLVTAALTAALRAEGVNALPCKPVQTGSHQDDDIGWILHQLADGTSIPSPDSLTLYRFPLPAAPHLAAREAGQTIAMGRIVEWATDLAARCDVLIVEGAGGLLVPLNERETMLDLIRALDARPILVSANRLGTLNHTALTLNEMKRRNLQPALVVINDVEAPGSDASDLIRNDNAATIRELAVPAPCVECPWHENPGRLNPVEIGTPMIRHLPAAT